MRSRPAYAPPFQAWSEMAPGVRSATRKRSSAALRSLAGEHARAAAVSSGRIAALRITVENLVRSFRSSGARACMTGIYAECREPCSAGGKLCGGILESVEGLLMSVSNRMPECRLIARVARYDAMVAL